MIYKLQLAVEGLQYKDLYLEVNTIEGFFMPDLEEDEEPNINILQAGEFIGIKQEDYIVEYLTKRFVDKAIKNKVVK